MLHPSRTVQFVAIAVPVGMYLLQVFVGRPDPVGVVRGAIGTFGGSPGPGDPGRTR